MAMYLIGDVQGCDAPLQRWASLVTRTDFAATYLALAHGIDPAITPHVAQLRRGSR